MKKLRTTYRNEDGKMVAIAPLDVIASLSNLYFEKTGTSPKMSFYSWLDAVGVEPNEKAWRDILENPDKYEFESGKE